MFYKKKIRGANCPLQSQHGSGMSKYGGNGDVNQQMTGASFSNSAGNRDGGSSD